MLTILFRSERLLIGLNCFEPGQEHAMHAHPGMDKLYQVLEGQGRFRLGDEEFTVPAGQLLVAPADIPHGVRNDSDQRLLLLAILAPAP